VSHCNPPAELSLGATFGLPCSLESAGSVGRAGGSPRGLLAIYLGLEGLPAASAHFPKISWHWGWGYKGEFLSLLSLRGAYCWVGVTCRQ